MSSRGYAEARAKQHAKRVYVKGRLVHPDAPHGTEYAYAYHGCRCPECTSAASEKAQERAARRREKPIRHVQNDGHD